MKAEDVKKELKKYAIKSKADFLPRFFKTGPGQYSEGDIFIGVVVPDTRKVAKKFSTLSLVEIKKLLYSKIHEERLCALLILVDQYDKADMIGKKTIFDFYIKNAKQVNNWDLVDLTAPKIVGEYLLNKSRSLLYNFAKSKNLWEKRISILATFAFIKKGEFEDTFKISEILMTDTHDLMHKAVGWMLREAGKRNQIEEEKFLKKYYKQMPRTMLRYSIEKFPESKRLIYLKGKI